MALKRGSGNSSRPCGWTIGVAVTPPAAPPKPGAVGVCARWPVAPPRSTLPLGVARMRWKTCESVLATLVASAFCSGTSSSATSEPAPIRWSSSMILRTSSTSAALSALKTMAPRSGRAMALTGRRGP